IRVVFAYVDDLHIRACECLFQTLVTLLSIGCVEHADKDHDLSTLRQRFLDELTCLTSSFDVVSADITRAVTAWCVAVLSHNKRLTGGAIEHWRLVGWIYGADGNSLYALGEQIVNCALLLGGGSVRRNSEFDLNAWDIGGGFFSAFAGDGPEVRSIVCYESESVLFAGPAGRLTANQDQGEQ